VGRGAIAAALLLALAATALASPSRVRNLSISLGGQTHAAGEYRDAVAAAAEQSGVDVLAPKRLQLRGTGRLIRHFTATAEASRRAWRITFESSAECNGANLCFVGQLASGLGRLPGQGWEHLELRDGTAAAFRGVSCGGSCAPATILFGESRRLYEIQITAPPGNPGSARERRAMVRMANSAIADGPR
jgi:hypothetical protein